MNDSLPTVWPAEPHTLAKHAILKEYLAAWMPILVRQGAKVPQGGEVLYVDGFAGPGEYSKGEDGSPIIALKAAMNHSAEFPSPIRFIFIELHEGRHAKLVDNVENFRQRAVGASKVKIETPIRGDCNQVLSGILADHETRGAKFGPALVFLDQFGYSAVPMPLIAKILKYPSCEVFSYLEYQKLNRFITDKTKAASIDAAFGGQEWRDGINMPSGQRDHFLLDTYKKALCERGGAKYITTFSMFDDRGQLLYWLFFCTGNWRGLEEMKKAMWKVDKSGTFRFSDAQAQGQERLFLNDGYTQGWLAEEIADKLTGQKVHATALREWVLTDTPCYLFREALATLEKNQQMKVEGGNPKRRVGTYPDECFDELVFSFVPAPLRERQETLFGS